MTAPAVAGREDAERLLARLSDVMDALAFVLDAETLHIASGRIREGLAAEARKAELSAAYLLALQACRANLVALSRFAPDRLKVFRAAQGPFERVVERNLSVLASARAVSETLVRDLAEETLRASRPAGYGSTVTPVPRQARAGPLVFSGRY